MKVKLNKKLVKEFGFGIGGDMSESIAVAVDGKGALVKYKDINKTGFIRTLVFEAMDLETDNEFLVVDHSSPISKDDYEAFKVIYDEVVWTNLKKLKYQITG